MESNLLSNEVTRPDADAIVVDGDELVVGVVEEFDFIRDVRTNVVTANGLTGLNLFKSKMLVCK